MVRHLDQLRTSFTWRKWFTIWTNWRPTRTKISWWKWFCHLDQLEDLLHRWKWCHLDQLGTSSPGGSGSPSGPIGGPPSPWWKWFTIWTNWRAFFSSVTVHRLDQLEALFSFNPSSPSGGPSFYRPLFSFWWTFPSSSVAASSDTASSSEPSSSDASSCCSCCCS